MPQLRCAAIISLYYTESLLLSKTAWGGTHIPGSPSLFPIIIMRLEKFIYRPAVQR